jgi:hypothetical protein
MKYLKTLAVSAATALISSAAFAVPVTFDRGVNDGVFSLTSDQAAALGAPTAEFIGFLGLRDTGIDNIPAGAIFDQTSIFSLISNDGNVLNIVNGTNGNVDYASGLSGNTFTTATLTSNDNRLFRGVGLLFSGNQTFNFAGGNISSGSLRGALSNDALDVLAPVPLPAAGWMLLAGVGTILAKRRRKLA